MVSGAQLLSQWPKMGHSPEMRACKRLRTKHFHEVSSRNQHLYLLKSRYGKVSLLCVLGSDDAPQSLSLVLHGLDIRPDYWAGAAV